MSMMDLKHICLQNYYNDLQILAQTLQKKNNICSTLFFYWALQFLNYLQVYTTASVHQLTF